MTTDTAADGLRARISRQSEDALGKLAQELLESPFVSGALSRAFEAREKAAQAQEVAMGALNLPSAGDLERLTRRVRSVSQRLEGVEDALDRVDERVGAMGGAGVGSLEQRLNAIEGQLSALAAQLAEPSPASSATRCRRAPSRRRAAQTDAHARGRREQARRREKTLTAKRRADAAARRRAAVRSSDCSGGQRRGGDAADRAAAAASIASASMRPRAGRAGR